MPDRVRDLSLLHSVQTASGIHPASYLMVTGDLSPRVMQPGREADYWTPLSAEFKNGGFILSLPILLRGVALNCLIN
jgi:hypothetical protein